MINKSKAESQINQVPDEHIEIANVCPEKLGYGFSLKVFSRDQAPAHMRMFDLDGNEITRILLTDKMPRNIDDIKEYTQPPKLSYKQKRAVLKWAQSRTKLAKEPLWLFSFWLWECQREE